MNGVASFFDVRKWWFYPAFSHLSVRKNLSIPTEMLQVAMSLKQKPHVQGDCSKMGQTKIKIAYSWGE